MKDGQYPPPPERRDELMPDPITIYLFAVLGIASLIDIRRCRIPNWLTYSTLAAGIFVFSLGKGFDGFLFSISGAAAGMGLLMMPYFIGGTGAGDVKLLGAVGTFIGPRGVFIVFLISCILGLIYGLIILASRGLLKSFFQRLGTMLKGVLLTRYVIYIPPSVKEKELRIRFGLAITCGTISYLLLGI